MAEEQALKNTNLNVNNRGAEITLYWLETSRSHRILWLLEDLQLSYTLKTFKRTADHLAPAHLKDVHPLGKSPIVTIQGGQGGQGQSQSPLVLAESGAIIEYLCDHFGGDRAGLVPKRYDHHRERESNDQNQDQDRDQDRDQDQDQLLLVGSETEAWLRYRYYMHYAEGSLMSLLIVAYFVTSIKSAPVPFFIKPITRMITGKIESVYLNENLNTHFSFLESQIQSAPDGGPFLCGRHLTAADIFMSFPLIAVSGRSTISRQQYPAVFAYVDRLKEADGYKRAVAKIIEVDGSFQDV
ncbi:hypothetical protein Egran_03025 [Elaphomyces granulatus]|uniref:GST N-terminal domain-containing protein n=1 Tax=Elaphomyces granulatus TaxID=519963 RepID=A0A232LYG5_9EURO|nr:hypothetical protein Egran_03025 [Elaphomyces granulatus]